MPFDAVLKHWPARTRKISRILSERGVLALLTATARKPVKYWNNYRRHKVGTSFDEAHGLDTEFSYKEEEVFPAMVPETQQGYDPVELGTFREILDLLPIRFEEFSFIDLGSGKGRALFVASELPFQRLVGVEYSPHYHQIACRNLEAYRLRSGSASRIELINGDATTFETPKGKSVVFLFNPFQGPTFSHVVANLQNALASGSEEIYVAYVNPVCRKELDTSPGFRILHDQKHRDPYRAFVIYHGAA